MADEIEERVHDLLYELVDATRGLRLEVELLRLDVRDGLAAIAAEIGSLG